MNAISERTFAEFAPTSVRQAFWVWRVRCGCGTAHQRLHAYTDELGGGRSHL